MADKVSIPVLRLTVSYDPVNKTFFSSVEHTQGVGDKFTNEEQIRLLEDAVNSLKNQHKGTIK